MAALSIDKVYQFVQFVSNKESRGWISPEEFNIAAELAQLEAYSKREAVFLANKATLNDMRPFMTKSAPLSPTAGIVAYPADLRHFIGARAAAGTLRVAEYTQGEWSDILASTSFAPTAAYPGCVQREDGVEVSPVSTSIIIEYIKSPTAPEWGYSVGGSGRPEYDVGSTTDFGFDEVLFLEIAASVLVHVGLNIDKDQLAQYGVAINQQA